jgi:peptidylamidoglycolate lyase
LGHLPEALANSRRIAPSGACICAITLCSSLLPAQINVRLDTTGEYEWVPGWLKPVEKGRIIHPVTVFAETTDRIFIGINGTSPAPGPDEHRVQWEFDPKLPGARVDHQVFVANRNGERIKEWSQWSSIFGSIHKITENPYDPDRHVWIIDRVSQQVMEFTNDGKKLVLALGEKGVAGKDDKHFDRPADICWLPDGTFFIADGFGNSRIVKFDKAGKYLTSWGHEGTGPGEFSRPQAVAVDAQRHVWVTDRKNRRIEIFDENGKFLNQWTGFEDPQKVLVTRDQNVWVLDAAASRFAKFDLKGKLLTYWGVDADPDYYAINQRGSFFGRLVAGGLAWPHDFSVDTEGNLYVVDGRGWTVDKFVPRKGADTSRLLEH